MTSLFQQYGAEFGVDPGVLSEIARLESSYDPSAINTWDINAQQGTPSAGIMQFIQPTFSSFYDQAAAARPELFAQMGPKDWMNPEQQIATASHAISQGQGGHWATYDRARAAAGQPGGERVQYGQSTSPDATPTSGTPAENVMRMVFAEDPDMAESMGQRMQRAATRHAGGGHSFYGSKAYDPNVGYGWEDAPRLEGETVQEWISRVGGEKFGLQHDPGIGQLYGGQHSAGSLHYDHRAADWGNARNNPAVLTQAANYFRGIPGVSEVIWQAPGHYDHLHVGF